MSFSRLVFFAFVLLILVTIFRGVHSETGTHGTLHESSSAR